MKLKLRLLLPAWIILMSSSSLAQGPLTNMELNRAPLRYFSGVELTELGAEDPAKSEQIRFYFTESFTAKLVDCEGCKVNTEIFYNQDVFNVAEHETLRQLDSRVTFVYREKYEVTLLSLNEITLELGISPADVLKIKLDRPMPDFANTGDDEADFILYKQELHDWIVDFPEEFRAFQANPELLKITFAEFKESSAERRLSVMSHQGGYLIMD